MSRSPGIIKAHSAQSLPATTLRAFQLNDVMDEARLYVAQAHAEADNTVRQAEDRLRQAEHRARQMEEDARKRGDERGRQEGYDRGLDEGREAGRKEAFEAASHEFAQQQASLVESCKAAISAIDTDRDIWLTSARQDLIELAVAIARRVACHVGREHREVVLANLEEAVRLVGARTDVTIAVNPLDTEAARAFAKSLIDMREQWQRVRVIDEPEISPGGCRVQWGSGAIDATLETQLDRIEAELNAGRANGIERKP
jgi:flagellar biosynthesis/type III secretory pathway protein FliH